MVKETQITHTLETERQMNKEDLARLRAEYNELEGKLRDLTNAFEEKQKQLDDLRVQAGIDARKLSTELCAA